jgi:hypothetical protein
VSTVKASPGCVCACVRVSVCVLACACVLLHERVNGACMRACVLCLCVRARVCVRACACARACVRACVRCVARGFRGDAHLVRHRVAFRLHLHSHRRCGLVQDRKHRPMEPKISNGCQTDQAVSGSVPVTTAWLSRAFVLRPARLSNKNKSRAIDPAQGAARSGPPGLGPAYSIRQKPSRCCSPSS